MPTAHVRLKPIQWSQEIGHYPQQGGEGRYLRATCTYDDDSNVRLSTGEIAPELTGHGLPLSKCEAYNRVYDQFYQSR
jgi:hypothetical protein